MKYLVVLLSLSFLVFGCQNTVYRKKVCLVPKFRIEEKQLASLAFNLSAFSAPALYLISTSIGPLLNLSKSNFHVSIESYQ